MPDVSAIPRVKVKPCTATGECCGTKNTGACPKPPLMTTEKIGTLPGSPSDRFAKYQDFSAQIKSGRNIGPLEKSSSASTLNVETPARCQLPFPTSEIISNVVMSSEDFQLTRLDKNDELPRFEVNGYTFKNTPLDVAIQNLVTETNIRVYSDDGLFPELSAENLKGELGPVLNELADAGDAYVRYDASKQRLYLSRYGRFELKVPGGRVGMYAVLDALRGAGLTDVQPDWSQNTLFFRVNKEKEDTIMRLVNTFQEDPRLVLMDVKVYRLATQASCEINWQDVIQTFGIKRVNMSINGIRGRILTTDHQRKNYTLPDYLKKYADVTLISQGVAVMPTGWKVRFDIGQCMNFATPERDLSLLLQSNIQPSNRIESNIALDTVNGEVTSFYSLYGVDDSLNIIGITGKVFNASWNGIEYLITMKPRILRLVK